MFRFDDELGGYVAELNGVEFICDEPLDCYEEDAIKLSGLYFEKLSEMIDFMLPELERFYGELDKAELPGLLGKPTIDLSACQIMYMEHALDEVHIIEFEYDGEFEEFFGFNIDG